MAWPSTSRGVRTDPPAKHVFTIIRLLDTAGVVVGATHSATILTTYLTLSKRRSCPKSLRFEKKDSVFGRQRKLRKL